MKEQQVQNEVEKEIIDKQSQPAAMVEENEEEKSSYIILPGITMSRKLDVKNGTKYYSYFVHGTLCGREVTVRVKPGKDDVGFTDVNAYVLLDLTFGENDPAQFAVQVLRRKDFTTNRISKSLQYFSYRMDADDGEIAAPLRFETVSDKALVLKLVQLSNKRANLNLPV